MFYGSSPHPQVWFPEMLTEDEAALSRPSGLHSIPVTRRPKAGGSIFGPLARASCKPHPGSLGATDPPRPALFSRSLEPLSATRSHAYTHIRAARVHTLPPPHPRLRPARGARTRRTHAEEWSRRRKEGTDPLPTDRLPGLGEGEERPENLRRGRKGAQRQKRRDAGDSRKRGQRMGRQGLARTRGLLQGWGLPQPLALGGGQSLDWTRGSRGISCPVVPELRALKDPT